MTIEKPPQQLIDTNGSDFVPPRDGKTFLPPVEREKPSSFLEAMKRFDLETVITPRTPIINVSLEFGNDREDKVESVGLKTGGGLGTLEGDAYEEMVDKLDYIACTLGYTHKWRQTLDGDFYQKEVFIPVSLSNIGFSDVGNASIKAGEDAVRLQVSMKEKGKSKVLTPSEPNLGWLYEQTPWSEKRLYQSAVLGFANYHTLKEQGYFPPDRVEKEPKRPDSSFKQPEVYPSAVRLNEAAAGLFAFAQLDDLCFNGASLKDAIEFVRSKDALTIHTGEQAAFPSYSKELYEKYVFPNLRSKAAKSLLENLIDMEGGESLSIGTIALFLSQKVNGVSMDHAQIASTRFKRHDGSSVDVKPVTNGIHKRWIDEKIYDIYKRNGIYGSFDLPAEDIEARIDKLDPFELDNTKALAEVELRVYLRNKRVDQYGNRVIIPEDKNIIAYGRRVDRYKQNDLPFDNIDELKAVLKEANAHLVIAGNVHPDNVDMKLKLQEMLKRIDADPELRSMVTFVQDYDEELAKRLIAGARVWLNMPEVGKEACGTSIFKGIGNDTIIVSIPDGGMLDNKNGKYIKIVGKTREEQSASLYAGLREAGKYLKKKTESEEERRSRVAAWGTFVKDQHKSYAGTISGARMVKDYVNHIFPQNEIDNSPSQPIVVFPQSAVV